MGSCDLFCGGRVRHAGSRPGIHSISEIARDVDAEARFRMVLRARLYRLLNARQRFVPNPLSRRYQSGRRGLLPKQHEQSPRRARLSVPAGQFSQKFRDQNCRTSWSATRLTSSTNTKARFAFTIRIGESIVCGGRQHQRPSDLMPFRSPSRLFVLAFHRNARYQFPKSAWQSRTTIATSVTSEMLSQ
jgi:hypothetical protein